MSTKGRQQTFYPKKTLASERMRAHTHTHRPSLRLGSSLAADTLEGEREDGRAKKSVVSDKSLRVGPRPRGGNGRGHLYPPKCSAVLVPIVRLSNPSLSKIRAGFVARGSRERAGGESRQSSSEIRRRHLGGPLSGARASFLLAPRLWLRFRPPPSGHAR